MAMQVGSPSFPGPPIVTKDEVLAKCAFFTKSQVWPREVTLDPVGWLSNFRRSEEESAVQLLNGVMYFSNAMIKEMFRSAFQQLSRTIARPNDRFMGLMSRWQAYVDSAGITFVTGEDEHPADSGHIFVRMTRDFLGIPEQQIRNPKDTLQSMLERGPSPVIFVDDFIGSGSQFFTTWNRPYELRGGIQHSFASLMQINPFPAAYVSVLSTEKGSRIVQQTCPTLILSAAHILDPRHSATHPESFLWPKELRASGLSFLREASSRVGIPSTGGTSTDDWQGFNELGLTLSFAHGTPDATIPLLRWNKDGFRPLFVGGGA